jgi:hypothetical protein
VIAVEVNAAGVWNPSSRLLAGSVIAVEVVAPLAMVTVSTDTFLAILFTSLSF